VVSRSTNSRSESWRKVSPMPRRCTVCVHPERHSIDEALGPIAAEHNAAIVLVHYLRETQSDDPLKMIAGSVGLTGGVDGALVLKRKRLRADALVYAEGCDIEEPTELALKFDQNAATRAIVGDAEEYRLTEGRRAILDLLKSSDQPLGPKDITTLLESKLGMSAPSYGAIRELLSQMARNGQVKNLGRGAYIHPDNTDILTTKPRNVSLSGLSGHLIERTVG
jgi:hypothetical protein